MAVGLEQVALLGFHNADIYVVCFMRIMMPCLDQSIVTADIIDYYRRMSETMIPKLLQIAI